MLLAPSAAVLCLILGGISLRREGGPAAVVGGNFAKWMFWAIVFITLPGLISWFPSFGVPATLPSGGIGTGWMANFQSDLTNFMNNLVVSRLATSLAAFFVLRAILDTVPASMTRFYLSANSAVDAADVPIGGRPLPALLPGANNSGSVTIVIPPQTPAGKYFIVAAADADGVVVEALENNNTKARNITITAP